jgi:hypothetical protein
MGGVLDPLPVGQLVTLIDHASCVVCIAGNERLVCIHQANRNDLRGVS